MTYRPSRDYLAFTGFNAEIRDNLLNPRTGPGSARPNRPPPAAGLRPYGSYGGLVSTSAQTLKENGGIVTNPWGVPAELTNFRLLLAPGQSVNLRTGQLSDPNITPALAKQLNANADFRAVNAAGLSAASAKTLRTQQSTLATVDQYYMGNQNWLTGSGAKLTGIDAVKEVGLQASDRGGLKQPANPTILGTNRRG